MRQRRYYGEKMMADGTNAAYPPSSGQEQQWRDGADYNAVAPQSTTGTSARLQMTPYTATETTRSPREPRFLMKPYTVTETTITPAKQRPMPSRPRQNPQTGNAMFTSEQRVEDTPPQALFTSEQRVKDERTGPRPGPFVPFN